MSCFAQGFHAYLAGKLRSANPYLPGTDAARMWNAGWNAAKAEMWIERSPNVRSPSV